MTYYDPTPEGRESCPQWRSKELYEGEHNDGHSNHTLQHTNNAEQGEAAPLVT